MREGKDAASLSTYIWDCKYKGLKPEISWSIFAKAHPYSSGSRACDLCLTEKTTILLAKPVETLNKRSEILSQCRHKLKYLLEDCLFYDPNPQIPP